MANEREVNLGTLCALGAAVSGVLQIFLNLYFAFILNFFRLSVYSDILHSRPYSSINSS